MSKTTVKSNPQPRTDSTPRPNRHIQLGDTPKQGNGTTIIRRSAGPSGSPKKYLWEGKKR